MRDINLYKAILGLAPPWTVVNVKLDVMGQQITVQVQVADGPFPCPECQTTFPGSDRKPRRRRHLDTCQFTSLDRGRGPAGGVPDSQCEAAPRPLGRAGEPVHGSVRAVRRGTAISRWSRIWSGVGSCTLRRTGSRRASTASGGPSPRPSGRGSTRSPWTCGSLRSR